MSSSKVASRRSHSVRWHIQPKYVPTNPKLTVIETFYGFGVKTGPMAMLGDSGDKLEKENSDVQKARSAPSGLCRHHRQEGSPCADHAAHGAGRA